MSTEVSAGAYTPGPFTTVRRDDRARYDRRTIHDIIDAAPMCHVGFVHHDRPVVIPTLHVRIGDVILLHGAHPSRLFRELAGTMLCIGATILDGWVLARSAMHHSANYRSVVAYGTAEPVESISDRRRVLEALMEKIAPGRNRHIRPTTDKELRATAVLAVPIEEASAKVRTGPPLDDDDDMALPIWAGEVPIRLTYGAVVPAPDLHPDATRPDHLGFFGS